MGTSVLINFVGYEKIEGLLVMLFNLCFLKTKMRMKWCFASVVFQI